jgi:hypothetical protein
MNRKPSLEKKAVEKERTDPEKSTAEEAAKAKEEEIRATLLTKGEQGQSTLASLPAREGKKNRKPSN